MNSLDILHYIIAVSVIIIALVIVGIGVSIMLLLYEAKKALRAVQKTAGDIQRLKENISVGVMGNIISLGKSFFQKKLPND